MLPCSTFHFIEIHLYSFVFFACLFETNRKKGRAKNSLVICCVFFICVSAKGLRLSSPQTSSKNPETFPTRVFVFLTFSFYSILFQSKQVHLQPMFMRGVCVCTLYVCGMSSHISYVVFVGIVCFGRECLFELIDTVIFGCCSCFTVHSVLSDRTKTKPIWIHYTLHHHCSIGCQGYVHLIVTP